MSFIAVLLFLLGVAVGSFLNVVILRYNTGRTVRGRSFCTACGKTLQWYELIPILSFLVQQGKCKSCGSKLAWQYPAVELLTGALFLGVHFMFTHLFPSLDYFLLSTFYVLIISLLMIITVYDIRHTIIPDPFVFAFIILSGLLLFVNLETLSFELASLSHILAGPVLASPFALLWYVSGGRWMGFGDAKLAWGIGWLLGLSGGVSAVVFGFWIGALYGLLALLFSTLFGRGGRFTMKSEVPFAPFLILGTLLVFFFDLSALGLVELLV